MNFQGLSERVRNDLLENHTEQDISLLTQNEAFESYLEYNGIIGFDTMIKQALFDIIVNYPNPEVNLTPAKIDELRHLFGLRISEVL